MISPGYGVSVRDLCELEGMRGAIVLAGRRGLDRMVSGVNVMEVPDIVDWVKPQELLVTTGFPLATGDDPGSSTLVRLVRDLHGRDVAGLGIKLGRYLDRIDTDVLAVADELDFPIIALPMALGFDDLLRQTFSRLNELATGVLERIDALHRALTLLVLEGGDLDQIAAEVARVLDVGILITSTDGRERAAALSEPMREALVEAELMVPGGRFRVERASTRPAALADGEVCLQPIAAGGSDLARLVCVSPHRALTRDDVVALERAATVAALLVTRQEAVAAVENKYRGDFLRDVFLGRAGDRTYVVEHAASLGWDLEGPLVVLSAELDPATSEEPPVTGRLRRTWQERFATAWRQVCDGQRPSIATVDFTAEVVALLPVPDGEVDAAVARLVAAVRGDRGGGRRPFSVGVSRLVSTPEQLPEAYLQARRATEVGRRVGGGGGTTRFDELGVHRLIALVPDPAEVRSFATDVLRELAQDTEEAADLRTTLQILLDTNLNVAEAARQQFFHYNTMRYRVSKLERILGPFTTDPHLRLDVAVALQVLAMRA
ncbi:PucR family transcriptional regulator ligand-binding domain-containing protein [Nocardioides sp.]|uniref:PucR family transcriptional regulator n=1 Tax=Nocardioides sp. TaxID=35761 RepID=UPI00286D2B44|nr:PucR family transcriptional regulator ligand-binding domain-containing protein [Nocardioides sp.]